ncbi:hypothetical protein GGQ73_004072 [Rhizobium skierniewicense]|uniref:Transposase IS4-like domain-containing protein n=1 Tax=Rhizobium skierniewicense TaxID=984260 RepID=A0A7W6C9E0_9HYPH|nr:hypothetical protein [Rhizobium skierniewicense]
MRGIAGYNAGETTNCVCAEIKGRKRTIVIDTLGPMVGLIGHGAEIQDPDGATAALKTVVRRWPRLRQIFADGGYVGPKLLVTLCSVAAFTLKRVKRTDEVKGFAVRPRHWVVESAHSPGFVDAGG